MADRSPILSPTAVAQRSAVALPRDVVSIQYLRGIAAAMVVFAHAVAQFMMQRPPAWKMIGQSGVSGVDLFFVISGFIMTYTIAKHPYSRTEFMLRRIARIAPLYWVMSALTALLAIFLPSLFQSTHFGWGNFLQSLIFVWSRDPVNGAIDPTLHLGWTLNYEMFFYVCFAAFLFLSPFLRVAALAVLFAGLILLAQWTHTDSPSLLKYGDTITFEFLFGSIAAAILVSGWVSKIPPAWLFGFLAIGVVALMTGSIFTEPANNRWLFRGIPAAIILLAMVAIELRHPWKNIVLHRIGDATYSIYLTHIFVVEGVKFVWRHAHLPTNDAAICVFVLVSVVASIALGIIVYEQAEKPMNAWTKDVLLGRGARTRRQPAAT